MNSLHPDVDIIRLGEEDISAHVPAQLCQKILAHQCIIIALLLNSNVELQALCSWALVHITYPGLIDTRPRITRDEVPNTGSGLRHF